MKPALETVSSSGLRSFLVRRFEEKSFGAPYHFHPEFELTFIVSGSGKRYVGANMSDFFPGDFIFLGAGLPHCWKTGNTETKEKSSSIVVHFQLNFLGNGFFEKPEMAGVLQLLHESYHGIRFTDSLQIYKKKMQELLEEQDNFKKVILLLGLLHQLSLSKKYVMLEKQRSHVTLSAVEQQRIHTVMAYIVEHFKDHVSLTAAASLASMTTPAFCKYFKRITRKTFVEAVTDYRVDYAAQQLIHTSGSVSQIGFDSGFNDLSHFHKMFKIRLKVSPLCYRNTFLQKL